MNNRNTTITEALNPLFWWAREPAVMAAAISSAIRATLNYVELMGHRIDDGLMGLIIAWVMVLGVVIRSQVYSPNTVKNIEAGADPVADWNGPDI